MKKISLVIVCLIAVVLVHRLNSSAQSSAVDCVIFSYDRPLQLYALLESLETYATGLHEKHVIYRASDEQFENGYAIVQHAFPMVQFHKQSSSAHDDFKSLTLKAAFDAPSEYIVFAVDDIVLKDAIDFSACTDALERYHAYGFYLRLGKNLSQCYPFGGRDQPLPVFLFEQEGICAWYFSQGQMDWAYPHTVDMTVYRKKDIASDFQSLTYHTPNKLEDMWHMCSRYRMSYKGICYETSKIVNLPLNRVQHEYANRAMTEYTPTALLDIFMQGYKMDIRLLKNIDNKAAHMEYSPTFITQ